MVPRSSVRSLVLTLVVLPQKILELVRHPLLANVGIEALEHLAELFECFAAQAAAGPVRRSHFVLDHGRRLYWQVLDRPRLRHMPRRFACSAVILWRRARHALLFRYRP